MGKGNRNRLGRVDTPVESQKATPKAKKSRKPLTKAAKIAVAGFLAILIVAGTVVGALSCNGVFRSRTTVVSGSLNNRNITLSEGVATALLWLNGFKHGSTQVSGAFNLSNGYYFLYSSSSTTNSYAAKVDSYLKELDLPAAGRVDSFDAHEAIRRADALMADYPAVLSRLKDKSAAMARAAGENERLLLEMLEQYRMH